MSFSLQYLADYLGAQLRGQPDYLIEGLGSLEQATEQQLTFVANPKYVKHLATSQAGAVLIKEAWLDKAASHCLVVENPYLAYAKLSVLFEVRPSDPVGIHDSAVIAPEADIAPTASVGAMAVIEAGAVIADGAIIGAHCFVGAEASIGARSRLAPHAVVHHQVRIGSDCLIHSGAIIGDDGFGFAPDGAKWEKIHQLGSVLIGDRVEIGGCATIDRGAIDDTVIGDGVKIDNLVQIAHNVKIGDNTAIAACVAIAGSTVVGERCTFAGMVGVNGHIKITDDAHFTGMSMVAKSVTEPGVYSSGAGNVTPNREWRKNAVRSGQLDGLFQRVKRLENLINDDE